MKVKSPYNKISCKIIKKHLYIGSFSLKQLILLLFILSPPISFGVEIKAMGVYNTNSVYRGALYWPGHVVKLYPVITLKGRFRLRGPEVFYKTLLENKSFDLDIGGRYFNDGLSLALYKKDHNLEYINQRSASLETFVKFKYYFGYKKLFTTQVRIGRDLIEHKGLYGELGAGTPIFPYTKLKGKIGFAEKSAQTYLYGPDASSGIGYGSLGLFSFFKNIIGKSMLIASIKHYWILNKNNRYTDYIRGKYQNFSGTLRIIFPFY
ncbi:MAG: hypothetical protein OXB84_08980 [Halobacteriovoraceae bacterium]|nr:hypothetical protein [Halobacteriovoraceae bacterium]